MKNSEMDKAQKTLQEIERLRNAANKPLVNTQAASELQVQIKVDKSISPGMFKPDTKLKAVYYAHPQTIKAMKKNIFTIGEDIDEFKEIIQCHSCSSHLDRQFWHFCPYCGSQFLADN